MSDVESVDLVFYNSLMYVLEEDPTPLDLTFTIQEQSFGEVSSLSVEWHAFGQQLGIRPVAMVMNNEEEIDIERMKNNILLLL